MAHPARRLLTRAEWQALKEFSDENGRFWKEVIKALWRMEKAPPLIQGLYKEKLYGEKWLRTFRLADAFGVEGDIITLRRDPDYNRFQHALEAQGLNDVKDLERTARELLLAVGDCNKGAEDDPAVIAIAHVICSMIAPESGDRYEAALKICLEKGKPNVQVKPPNKSAA